MGQILFAPGYRRQPESPRVRNIRRAQITRSRIKFCQMTIASSSDIAKPQKQIKFNTICAGKMVVHPILTVPFVKSLFKMFLCKSTVYRKDITTLISSLRYPRTVRADHERRAAEICREVMGEDVHISISSEIGSMGLIERENATILNAALCQVAERFTEGFAYSLAQEGITNAEVYLSQNDGTLMTMEHAHRYPILTIACGPTNSIRGASYLSHLDNAIVIDVGGTTTDLGVIQSGFPRESGVAVTIGGVRTNFRMPDVYSIGLGGGSIVRQHEHGTVTVGPDSVGYRLTEKALVFGGDTLTATDIAVRLGMANIGDPEKVAHISESLAQKAMAAIRELVEESIDVMKVSSGDIDIILVGGGSILLPETLAGARSVTKPDFFGTANAIGSAISKVSGTYEALIDYNELPREQALEKAKQEAIEMAVSAGAKRETVEIIEMEDVPLAYYPGNTCRVKVKSAGELQ